MEITPDGTKGKRVAILFANLKGNIGDYAILEAMAELLFKIYPGHEVVAYAHPLVGIDAERLAEFKRLSPRIIIAGRTYSKEIPWCQRMLSSSFLRRRMQSGLIRSFADEAAPSLAHFAEYEAVFIAGGDQWSGRELGHAMFGTLSAIHRYNENIHAFPFSLKSSILGLYARETLAEYFGKLHQPLLARDSLTKGIIDGFSDTAVQAADCVYSLNKRAGRIEPAGGRDRSRILFVVKGQEDDLSKTLEKLIGGGIGIELLTTCPQEDNRVYQKLAARFGLTYHEPMSWQEIIAEFKASSLVVTNRLHGLILGSLAETPLLPVSNRKKSLAFVQDAGMPHAAPTPSDISAALIEKTKSDRELVLARMGEYAESCRRMPHCPAG